MAASVYQVSPVATSNNVTGTVGAAATLGAAVAAGSTLVAVIASYRYNTAGDIVASVASTVNGSNANTWTEVLSPTQANDTVHRGGLSVFVAENVSAGTTVVTPTFTAADGNYAHMVVYELRGVATSSVVDQTCTPGTWAGGAVVSINVATSSAATAGAVSIIAATGRYLYLLGYSNTGYTDGANVDSNAVTYFRTASKVLGASAVETANFTVDWADSPGIGVIITFKPAAVVNLRIRATGLPSSINSVTAVQGLAWPTGPTTAKATQLTATNAEASGGTVLFPAPSWATAGQTVQVYVYKTSSNLSSGLFPATVESY